jgi:hypothetical protein
VKWICALNLEGWDIRNTRIYTSSARRSVTLRLVWECDVFILIRGDSSMELATGTYKLGFLHLSRACISSAWAAFYSPSTTHLSLINARF